MRNFSPICKGGYHVPLPALITREEVLRNASSLSDVDSGKVCGSNPIQPYQLIAKRVRSNAPQLCASFHLSVSANFGPVREKKKEGGGGKDCIGSEAKLI